MLTPSNGNIFRVTGHLCGESPITGEFPAQRPVTWSYDAFFDLHLNKWLSKQSWGWWFETPSHPLWRHCNVFCCPGMGPPCSVKRDIFSFCSSLGCDDQFRVTLNYKGAVAEGFLEAQEPEACADICRHTHNCQSSDFVTKEDPWQGIRCYVHTYDDMKLVDHHCVDHYYKIQCSSYKGRSLWTQCCYDDNFVVTGALKRKCNYYDGISVTDCTDSCQNDKNLVAASDANFIKKHLRFTRGCRYEKMRCCRRRQMWQCENSVFINFVCAL